MKFILYILSLITTFSQSVDIIYLPNTSYIKLQGEIESVMADEFISNLFEQDNDFYIYINSNGGDVESGMKIIKMMKYLQSENIKIKCIAKKAFSMAFHIYQRCDERLYMSSSILMQHEVTIYIGGNIEESQQLLTKYSKLSDEIITYESNKLNIDKDEYIRNLKKEIWFSGDDILTHNAGDRRVLVMS